MNLNIASSKQLHEKIYKAFIAGLLCCCITGITGNAHAQSNIAQVEVQSKNSDSAQQPPIQDGERFSTWMLREKQLQNNKAIDDQANSSYYLGTSWQTPKETTDQNIEKQSLINTFEKMDFPENDPVAQKTKKAFAKLINELKVTGRVRLTNTNPRFLEASPKLDPVLEKGDRITIPQTPSTLTVIRSNGTLCKIRYRPNIEARHYVDGCKLRGKNEERNADWAWVVEPDGSIHHVSLAAWNSAKQDLPAPGSWIWAPPRWSKWTNKTGDQFSKELAGMLAKQGLSGIDSSIDEGIGNRGALQTIDPKDLYSTSRDLPISANIWGETGLLQTPTARTAPAGTGAMTLGLFQPYGNLNLFFAPVNGMEFIMRYTNINNIPYGEQSLSGGQTYKDKSVGLKVRLINENFYLPEVAVGARDMLGTGLFSGEYFVATKRHNDFDYTLGMGWGQLGTRNNVTNPFVTAFGQNYATRPPVIYNQGGTSTGGFFHGTAALFGGVQYHTPWDNIVLKAEVDGNNYQQLPFSNTLPVKSIFNFGVTYQMKNADFTVGSLGNSQVMFIVSLHERLDLLNTPKLAEAKAVSVDLKTVGSYVPTNPALWINTGNSKASTTTASTTAVRKSDTKSDTQLNAKSDSNINTNTKVATNSTNSAIGKNSTNQSNFNNLNSSEDIPVQAQSASVNPTPAVNAQNLTKQNITTAYNQTLLDFEQQTQWQVKGLQGTHNKWTVHLLDASGVFVRSRINRGVAVLHRDAPSQIETFQIQFYNWGMLVSEFSINRKQWMLSQTQLLAPSQIFPPITVASTAKLPADGGNPFFRDRSGNAANLNSVSVGNTPASTEEPEMVDELEHKALKTNLGISYAQVVGGPDSQFLFALGIKGDAIYKFRENTWVTGTINTRVIDNFGLYVYQPPPTGLQPVRTDIRQYMTQSIATMPNLQITNTGKIANDHFVSAYAGYLEMMFAGAGGEYLWRPTDSKLAVGIDVNRVRQRQFNVWTSMQNYAVTTGHLTTYWDTGVQDILVKAIYGKYLAGDVGGTLDVSRVFQNGVRIGAYATRTNVNYVQFGEGSFEKGLYISVPFDAFFAKHSDSSANLLFTPLIRDGGAMLYRKYRLYDMTRTRDPGALSLGPD